MIATGCFDESERDEVGAPIVVAGYLFKPAGYKAFRRLWWRNVLNFGRRRHFHMTDLCAGWGVYQGLGIPARQKILGAAVDAIVPNMYAGIGIHFDRAEFEAVAPPEWPARFGSIYTMACRMCLEATADWMDQKRSHLQVLYVFERGHKRRAEADDLLTAIGNHARLRKRYRYTNHRFEDKDDEYGIQAADILAWSVTKGLVGAATRAFEPFRHQLRKLVADNERYAILSCTKDKLEAFVALHMTGALGVAGAAKTGPRRRTFR